MTLATLLFPWVPSPTALAEEAALARLGLVGVVAVLLTVASPPALSKADRGLLGSREVLLLDVTALLLDETLMEVLLGVSRADRGLPGSLKSPLVEGADGEGAR